MDNYNSFDHWTSLFFNKINESDYKTLSFELDWNTILKYNVFSHRKYTNENEDVADEYKTDESPVVKLLQKWIIKSRGSESFFVCAMCVRNVL